MWDWILIFFIVVVLILIYIYNFINQHEDKVLFCPSKKKCWKPKIPYENIYLNRDDWNDYCHTKEEKEKGEKGDKKYLSCWLFNNYPGKKYICFFHGNTGNIHNRKYIINFCHRFKLNLFVFDYSGYGESTSFPHKLFLRENGETVFNFLNKTKGIKASDIVIWSESLGCLPAAYICSKYNCGGLILLCAFSSLDDIVNYQYEGYKGMASRFLTQLLSYKMDFLPVKEYLDNVKCPVVVVHSKTDEIIPYECSKINYERIKHDNKIRIDIEGGHSNPRITTRQLRRIFHFCELPDDLSSGTIGKMLESLETFANRHNNFMD